MLKKIHCQVSGCFICFNASNNVLYSHCDDIHALTLENAENLSLHVITYFFTV